MNLSFAIQQYDMPEAVDIVVAGHSTGAKVVEVTKTTSGEKLLQLDAAIGFSGKQQSTVNRISNNFIGQVSKGYLRHPDGKYIVYPVGSTVVIKDPKSPKSQTFLNGHSNIITSLAISPSGKYIASGQQTHMGYQVQYIILFISIIFNRLISSFGTSIPKNSSNG